MILLHLVLLQRVKGLGLQLHGGWLYRGAADPQGMESTLRNTCSELSAQQPSLTFCPPILEAGLVTLLLKRLRVVKSLAQSHKATSW